MASAASTASSVSADAALANEWRLQNLAPATVVPEEVQTKLLFQGVAPIPKNGADYVVTIVEEVRNSSQRFVLHASHLKARDRTFDLELDAAELGSTRASLAAQRQRMKDLLSRIDFTEGKLVLRHAIASPAAAHSKLKSALALKEGADAHDHGAAAAEAAADPSTPAASAALDAPTRPRTSSPVPNPSREHTSTPPPVDDDAAVLAASNVRVRVVTWNMQAKQPPSNEVLRRDLLPGGFQLYVIGTQECENTIAMSVIKTSKARWERQLSEVLGDRFELLCGHTLQATHQIVFVHRALAAHVSNIASTAVSTGVGVGSSRLGTKGGIAIRFNIGTRSFCFITGHLAAHQKAFAKRNQDYHKITAEVSRRLLSNPEGGWGGSKVVQDHYAISQLQSDTDYLVWLGDLNYRVDLERSGADAFIEQKEFESLWAQDQLCKQRRHKFAFQGMDEAPVTFWPTYKFNFQSDEYDTSAKQRVPSWTDRILFKPAAGLGVLQYEAATQVRVSDHRPVYADFAMDLDLQHRRRIRSPDHKPEGGQLGQTTSQVCSVM